MSKKLPWLTVAFLLAAATARAQDTCPCPPAPPPEPAWKASLGGGLSLTGGNTNVDSYNLSVSVAHDPHRRNSARLDGLYLRSTQDGETTADKASASLRDEYRLGRAYLLAQLGYLRDPLKQLDYLLSPSLGAGYRLLDRKGLLLSADASLGGALERLQDRDGTSAFALSVSQHLEWQASPSLKLAEKASALWKTGDFEDAYYHFEAGLVAGLAKRLEFKLLLVDDYKRKPASPGLKRNDTAFVAALVVKT